MPVEQFAGRGNISAHLEIFFHRQSREEPSVFRHMGNPCLDNPVRGNAKEGSALHHQISRDHRIQARDHPHQSGFPGAVGTYHSYRFSRIDLERDVLQGPEGTISRGNVD
jgi:hypothetical protein